MLPINQYCLTLVFLLFRQLFLPTLSIILIGIWTQICWRFLYRISLVLLLKMMVDLCSKFLLLSAIKDLISTGDSLEMTKVYQRWKNYMNSIINWLKCWRLKELISTISDLSTFFPLLISTFTLATCLQKSRNFICLRFSKSTQDSITICRWNLGLLYSIKFSRFMSWLESQSKISSSTCQVFLMSLLIIFNYLTSVQSHKIFYFSGVSRLLPKCFLRNVD